jgi:DNA-binding PadR family transcriptional regulator
MHRHFFGSMHHTFHQGYGRDDTGPGPGQCDGHERHAGRGPFGRHRPGGDAFGEWSDLRGGGRHGGGRMFGHGDLKLLLLALIEQQPRHGYELIRIIEEMFHGQYTPSPGAIYPTLTMLEELGHAEIQSAQGNRKLYAITEDGRAFLDENRDAVEAVTERTRRSARMAAKMAMPAAVHKAMHAIKHAMLMRGTAWSKDEAQRIAAILERAAQEIATGGPRD